MSIPLLRPARISGPAIALATALGIAAPALALEPLNQNKYVNDRLIGAQVGDYIRKTCPSIGARILRALDEAHKLESWAKKQGYTDKQIDAFINSKSEQKRVKDAAKAYMASKGVVEGDVESYCRLGRDEIAANTITGSLLYAK